MSRRPLRVLTIGHSYVVALNQRVPALVAQDPTIELTLAAPRYHHGDLRPLRLEKTEDPAYRIVPLAARCTRRNHLFWYDHHALRRLLREGRFDVVHAWEEPYTYAGYEIARATPSASRFLFRTAQSIAKRYPWPFSRFERETVRRADGWVAGGRLVFDAMCGKGFPAERGRVIPLGVDMDVFRPLTDEARHAVRGSLGLEPPVVGFVGRLVPEKGLAVLMAALERVTQPWSLLVLGSGPEGPRLERWARDRGFDRRLRIVLARHDEVPRYLAALDLVLAPSLTTPSWKEQFGRMVIEAFACRVPVVGSDSGEIPHVIGDAGVLLPEGDVAAWSETIDALLGDEPRRTDLATRGYQRCHARFAAAHVSRAYVTLYHDLAERSA